MDVPVGCVCRSCTIAPHHRSRIVRSGLSDVASDSMRQSTSMRVPRAGVVVVAGVGCVSVGCVLVGCVGVAAGAGVGVGWEDIFGWLCQPGGGVGGWGGGLVSVWRWVGLVFV